VVFVGDPSRSHDDGRDRVVDDFRLSPYGDAAALATASQLSDQLAAAPVQLFGRILWRPSAAALPRPDHARPSRPEPQGRDTPPECRKPLIHE
jgi:hypothetical protein